MDGIEEIVKGKEDDIVVDAYVRKEVRKIAEELTKTLMDLLEKRLLEERKEIAAIVQEETAKALKLHGAGGQGGTPWTPGQPYKPWSPGKPTHSPYYKITTTPNTHPTSATITYDVQAATGSIERTLMGLVKTFAAQQKSGRREP